MAQESVQVMEQKTEKMTVAEGLTRCKRIEKQLDKLADDIGKYGVWYSENRHPLGETSMDVPLSKNHATAKEKVESLFQKFHDLVRQYQRIKTAIALKNQETTITIKEKTMTMAEALVLRPAKNVGLYLYFEKLSRNYLNAMASIERKVENENNLLKQKDYDKNKYESMKSHVLYMVKQERVKEIDEFLTEFLIELDGAINASNAITIIEVPV